MLVCLERDRQSRVIVCRYVICLKRECWSVQDPRRRVQDPRGHANGDVVVDVTSPTLDTNITLKFAKFAQTYLI